ncbi:FtsH protease activity modulator HflK [Aureimonas leprariae]|uniref:Protein HflK n=1 Tax=Plantimonas leprariae TaxID=2615207 RepID=A0A7V7PS60_9HYPH|nr:FtsH protease activity modulator HflK [Aureimonas leprariae]KAB0681928.1 FtsH protease activity modulator HflK [Aureimonas leprariae]
MPWSNQTGGGGWRGGNSGGGGPWGQGPQSPRPGNNNSPDLEDILRRGQDRLRRALPGGSGSSGGFAFGAALIAVLGITWALNAVHMVQPGEYGVKVFLGKPRQELVEPGLAFTAWPLESFETVPAVENQLVLGNEGAGQSGLMLSGDQNLVNVQFAVLYQITDPQSYLFNVADPQGLLRQTASSAMREIVGRNPVDDLFRDARASIAEQVRSIMQDTLDRYGSGVRVNAVSIEETAPPQQVASAFDEVQRAAQDQDRFVDEANIYRNKKLGDARGEAVQVRQDAAAYKDRVTQEAEGESQRFASILDQYRVAPDITRRRIWVETIENALQRSNKFIVDGQSGTNGVVPYLPLNQLPQTQGNSPPANPSLSGAPPLQSTGASRLNALGNVDRGTAFSTGGQEVSR